MCVCVVCLAVGVFYRPPYASIACLYSLEEVLVDVNTNVDQIVMVGELNMDFLKNYRKFRYLMRILDAFDLLQIIGDPTRLGGSSDTLICVNKRRKYFTAESYNILNVSNV